MNRRCFRLIYNRSVGALVPVAEWVSGKGKSPSRSVAVTQTPPHLSTPRLLLLAVGFALGLTGLFPAISAQPLPQGAGLSVGAGSISQGDSILTVFQQSQKLGINWQSFNVGTGNTVNFVQPNANSIALNRVVGENRSEIYGAINANGKVFLINQHGVLFGKTAEVNVGSLLATTKNITDIDFLNDRFNLMGSSHATNPSEVINQGNLRADNGRIVLAGNVVRNEGTIATPHGRTTLAAGEKIALWLDALGQIEVAVTQGQLDALVENQGLITANNGGVFLTAKGINLLTKNAVNMIGSITANGGTVVLDGGDSGVVQVNNGKLDVSNANGQGGAVVLSGQYVGVLNGATIDASGREGGGRVIVGGDTLHKATDLMAVRLADKTFVDARARIDVSSSKGDGGFVETSGHTLGMLGTIQGSAGAGKKSGLWLIDPSDITIDTAASNATDTSNVWTGAGTGTYIVNNASIEGALNTGTDVCVTTASAGTSTGNMSINASIQKTAGGNANLTLFANGSMTFADGVNLTSNAGTLGMNFTANQFTFGNTSFVTNGGNLRAFADADVSGTVTIASVTAGKTLTIDVGAGTGNVTIINRNTTTTANPFRVDGSLNLSSTSAEGIIFYAQGSGTGAIGSLRFGQNTVVNSHGNTTFSANSSGPSTPYSLLFGGASNFNALSGNLTFQAENQYGNTLFSYNPNRNYNFSASSGANIFLRGGGNSNTSSALYFLNAVNGAPTTLNVLGNVTFCSSLNSTTAKLWNGIPQINVLAGSNFVMNAGVNNLDAGFNLTTSAGSSTTLLGGATGGTTTGTINNNGRLNIVVAGDLRINTTITGNGAFVATIGNNTLASNLTIGGGVTQDTINLTATRDLNITGTVNVSNNVALTSSGGDLIAGGSVLAAGSNGITLLAAGNVSLNGAVNATLGNITVAAGKDTVAGNATGTGEITVGGTASGNMTVGAGKTINLYTGGATINNTNAVALTDMRNLVAGGRTDGSLNYNAQYGDAAGNATSTFNVLFRKRVTVDIATAPVTNSSKTYDGTNVFAGVANIALDSGSAQGDVLDNGTGVNISVKTSSIHVGNYTTNDYVVVSNNAISNANFSGGIFGYSSNTTTSSNVNANITQRTVYVDSAAGLNKTYGQDDATNLGTQYTHRTADTNTGLVGTDAIVGNMGREIGEQAGNYNYTNGSLFVGNTSFNDYNVVFDGTTNNYTINKAQVNVSATASNKTFGTNDGVLGYTHDWTNKTGVGYFNTTGAYLNDGTANASITGNVGRNTGEAVANYTMTNGSLTSNDLSINFTAANFTISQAQVNVSATASNKTFGTNDGVLGYTHDWINKTSVGYYNSTGAYLTNGTANASITGNVGRNTGEAVANYAMTNGSLTSNDLSINFTAANFTITQAQVNVSATASNKSYGANDGVLGYTHDWTNKTSVGYYNTTGAYLTDGIANASITGNVGRNTGEAVANYAMTNGSLTGGSNVSINFTTADFTITKANLTATLNANQSKIYGDDDTALATVATNLTYNDLVNRSVWYYNGTGDYVSTTINDTGNVNATIDSLTRTTNENVGNHSITGGTVNSTIGGTAAGNYQWASTAINTTDRVLEITKRAVSVNNITVQDKTYDGTTTASACTTGYSISAVNRTEVYTWNSNVSINDSANLSLNASGVTANFETEHAGNAINVALSNVSISGSASVNYLATTATASATANITQRSLYVNATADSKTYDGTTSATVQAAINPAGVVNGDQVNLRAEGEFARAEAGNDIQVRIRLILEGIDAGNYSLGESEINRLANIIQKPVDIVPSEVENAPAVSVLANALVEKFGESITQPLIESMLLVASNAIIQAQNEAINQTNQPSKPSKDTEILAWTKQVQETQRSQFATSNGGNILNVGDTGATRYSQNSNNLLVASSKSLTQSTSSALALSGTTINFGGSSPVAPQVSSTVLAAASSSASDSASATAGASATQSSGGGASTTSSALYSSKPLSSLSRSEALALIGERKKFKEGLLGAGAGALENEPNAADMRPCPVGEIRGDCRIEVTTRNSNAPPKKHALLIGINQYLENSIPALTSAVKDIQGVAAVLEAGLGYSIESLVNPTRSDIVLALNQLATNINSGDSVIIYFAGHGYYSDKLQSGFWMPSNASTSDPKTWIANADISRYIKAIGAKQTLLVADSCYSGTLVDYENDPVAMKEELSKATQSLVVISSGGDEPVSDEGNDGHSIFAWHFINAMKNSNLNQTSVDVFEKVRENVTKDFPQTPKYGVARTDGGRAKDYRILEEKLPTRSDFYKESS